MLFLTILSAQLKKTLLKTCAPASLKLDFMTKQCARPQLSSTAKVGLRIIAEEALKPGRTPSGHSQ